MHTAMHTASHAHSATRTASMNPDVVTETSIDYFVRFGETVPRELCRWAENTQQRERLEQMLAERIRREEPIDDWYEFARPLVEPLLGVY